MFFYSSVLSAGCPNSKHWSVFHLRETITTSLRGCNIHSNIVVTLLMMLSRKAEAELSFALWEQMHGIMDLMADVIERLKDSIFSSNWMVRLYPQRWWSLPKGPSLASWMADLRLVDAQSSLITVQKLPNKPVQQSVPGNPCRLYGLQDTCQSNVSQFEFLPDSQ